MTPRAGYWRTNNLTDRFYACPNKDACLGSPSSTELNTTGECAEGYEGNKCQVCSVGYFSWGNTHCSKCPSQGVQAGTRIVILMVVIWLTVLLANSTQSTHVKIYINYLHSVMLIGTFQLSWSYVMRQLLNAQEAIGAFPEIALSLNCLYENETQEDSFTGQLILMSVIQPVLVGLSCCIWLLICLLKKTTDYLKHEMVASAIVVVFFTYPSVVRVMMQLWTCEEMEPGEWWVVGQPIRCWTNSHSKYALGLALPCVLVWGCSLPLAVAVTIYRQRNSLETVQREFGFLVGCYEPKMFYWELIITLRKMLIIAVTVAFSSVSTAFQALTSLLVLSVSILVHRSMKPFTDPTFNSLELQGLLVTVITLYAGLLYSTSTLNNVAQSILSAVIISANLYFTVLCWKQATILAIVKVAMRLTRRQEVKPT